VYVGGEMMDDYDAIKTLVIVHRMEEREMGKMEGSGER
jgi:hypothetical protein